VLHQGGGQIVLGVVALQAADERGRQRASFFSSGVSREVMFVTRSSIGRLGF
jgi:hypothetical protein